MGKLTIANLYNSVDFDVAEEAGEQLVMDREKYGKHLAFNCHLRALADEFAECHPIDEEIVLSKLFGVIARELVERADELSAKAEPEDDEPEPDDNRKGDDRESGCVSCDRLGECGLLNDREREQHPAARARKRAEKVPPPPTPPAPPTRHLRRLEIGPHGVRVEFELPLDMFKSFDPFGGVR